MFKWFGTKPPADPAPEPQEEPDPTAGLVYPVGEPDLSGPQPGQRYDGRVCFSDGSHYPVLVNEDGSEAGPDLTQRLLWRAANEYYVYATDTDPTHLHLYHRRHTQIEVN